MKAVRGVPDNPLQSAPGSVGLTYSLPFVPSTIDKLLFPLNGDISYVLTVGAASASAGVVQIAKPTQPIKW